jgi:hypothetical protein
VKLLTSLSRIKTSTMLGMIRGFLHASPRLVEGFKEFYQPLGELEKADMEMSGASPARDQVYVTANLAEMATLAQEVFLDESVAAAAGASMQEAVGDTGRTINNN